MSPTARGQHNGRAGQIRRAQRIGNGQPTHVRECQRITFIVAVGSCAPHRREIQPDEIRPQGRELFPLEVRPLGIAGIRIGDEHVGLGHQLQQSSTPLRFFNIQTDTFLSEIGIQERDTFFFVRGLAHKGASHPFPVALRRLHLDDLTAKGGEEFPAVGAFQSAGIFQDPDTRKHRFSAHSVLSSPFISSRVNGRIYRTTLALATSVPATSRRGTSTV